MEIDLSQQLLIFCCTEMLHITIFMSAQHKIWWRSISRVVTNLHHRFTNLPQVLKSPIYAQNSSCVPTGEPLGITIYGTLIYSVSLPQPGLRGRGTLQKFSLTNALFAWLVLRVTWRICSFAWLKRDFRLAKAWLELYCRQMKKGRMCQKLVLRYNR